MPQHVKKGDMVIVTSGRFGGQQGTVLRVDPKAGKVIVQKVNLCRKHVRPSQRHPQGGLISKELPIDLSNVSPVVNGRPTRVRFVSKPDGSKVRIAVKGGEQLGTLRQPVEQE